MGIFKKKETTIIKKFLEYAYKLELHDSSGMCANSVIFDEMSQNSIKAILNDTKIKEGLYTLIAYMLTGDRLQNSVVLCNDPQNKHVLLEVKGNWVQLEERRRTPKVNTNLDAELIIHEATKPIHYPCKLKNISLAGVFIVLETTLPLHTEGILLIKDIDVTIGVLLLRRQKDNSGYGCLFQNNIHVAETEQKIVRYVYEQQRSLRVQTHKYRENLK